MALEIIDPSTIPVYGKGPDSAMEKVLRYETWANQMLLAAFYSSPEKRYILKSLLVGESIIKQKNTGVAQDGAKNPTRNLKLEIPVSAVETVNIIPYGGLDIGKKYDISWKTKECTFKQYSINALMVRDDINELVRAEEHFKELVKNGVLQKYMHDETLIINALETESEIEEIFPGELENVDAVSDAADGTANKLTFAMIQKARLSFKQNTTLDAGGNKKSNPIPGFKNSANYLLIITAQQEDNLMSEPEFAKLFKNEGGITSEYQTASLDSMYLGTKIVTSESVVLRKGTGEGEAQKAAQAGIMVGGNNIIREIKLGDEPYQFSIARQSDKKLGSDNTDPGNLLGLRIVAKWFTGFLIPDPNQIKLLCYKKEGIY